MPNEARVLSNPFMEELPSIHDYRPMTTEAMAEMVDDAIRDEIVAGRLRPQDLTDEARKRICGG